MEEDNFCGQMVENMWAIGFLVNKKVLVLITCLINQLNMGCGRMEREHNG